MTIANDPSSRTLACARSFVAVRVARVPERRPDARVRTRGRSAADCREMEIEGAEYEKDASDGVAKCFNACM